MELRFDPSGELTIVADTLSRGQGHETSYAQMVADWLGVPEELRILSGYDRSHGSPESSFGGCKTVALAELDEFPSSCRTAVWSATAGRQGA